MTAVKPNSQYLGNITDLPMFKFPPLDSLDITKTTMTSDSDIQSGRRTPSPIRIISNTVVSLDSEPLSPTSITPDPRHRRDSTRKAPPILSRSLEDLSLEQPMPNRMSTSSRAGMVESPSPAEGTSPLDGPTKPLHQLEVDMPLTSPESAISQQLHDKALLGIKSKVVPRSNYIRRSPMAASPATSPNSALANTAPIPQSSSFTRDLSPSPSLPARGGNKLYQKPTLANSFRSHQTNPSFASSVNSPLSILTTDSLDPPMTRLQQARLRKESLGMQRAVFPPLKPQQQLQSPKFAPTAWDVSDELSILERSENSKSGIKVKESKAEKKARLKREEEEFDQTRPPTARDMFEASVCEVIDGNGESHLFGDLIHGQRTVVAFIRHWYCPLCQDFMWSIVQEVDPDTLHRHGVKLIIIGNGSPNVIHSYQGNIFQCPFPVYSDPSLSLYRALGMTRQTGDAGKEEEKGEYVKHGTLGGTAQVAKNLGKMGMKGVTLSPGHFTQLGGEFVLGPGLSVHYTSRMTTTRAHAPITTALLHAGVSQPRYRHMPSDVASEIGRGTPVQSNTWQINRDAELARMRVWRAERRKGKVLSVVNPESEHSTPKIPTAEGRLGDDNEDEDEDEEEDGLSYRNQEAAAQSLCGTVDCEIVPHERNSIMISAPQFSDAESDEDEDEREYRLSPHWGSGSEPRSDDDSASTIDDAVVKGLGFPVPPAISGVQEKTGETNPSMIRQSEDSSAPVHYV